MVAKFLDIIVIVCTRQKHLLGDRLSDTFLFSCPVVIFGLHVGVLVWGIIYLFIVHYLIGKHLKFDFSARKVLETRSMTDDSRISQLEEELKEAKWIAEDADRKYDEVPICMLRRTLSFCLVGIGLLLGLLVTCISTKCEAWFDST